MKKGCNKNALITHGSWRLPSKKQTMVSRLASPQETLTLCPGTFAPQPQDVDLLCIMCGKLSALLLKAFS